MDEDSSKSLPKSTNIKNHYKRQRYKSDHIIRKRVPPRDIRGPNDIYITTDSDFRGQLAYCVKALDKGESEIVLCGLGAAVPRAINLALQLEDKYSGSYSLDVHTNTIHLVELVQWLGLTVFELWINLFSISIFMVLLTLRCEGITDQSETGWWIVFAPLFVADALNAYFCVIVLIRMYLEALYKVAFFRALWSFCFLTAIFSFELLLCKKLSGETSLEYSEVLSPIFILLQLMAVRACQLH